MIIPEVYALMQRTYSKIDPPDLDVSKKEVSELLAEKRRLNTFYREPLKDIINPLKQYNELKRKIISVGGNVLTEDSIVKKRNSLVDKIRRIDFHQEEILYFSEKFAAATRRIHRYQREQKKIERRLKVSEAEEITGRPRRTVQYALRTLVSKGFLQRLGMGAGSRYQLVF